ncbi:helix-turn-helix domain-containing protein [Actinotalea caeni]|uniref:helix-turn-helix domain-containing protein n=1 Tax=Actinotalea caeni TaxID=1348467 RepID=UPI0012E1FA9B
MALLRLNELCEQVGITVANLNNVTTGTARSIRFSTLAAVCQVFDCPPATCSGTSPTPPRPDDRGSASGPLG